MNLTLLPRTTKAAICVSILFCSSSKSLAVTAPDATPGEPVVIFQEDWNDVSGFPNRRNDLAYNRTNYGVPTRAEGSDNDWLAARFEYSHTGYLDWDIGVSKPKSRWRYTNPAGRVDDDAGLVAQLDLTGFKDVELTFDWRTYDAERNDRLVVAYYIGNDLGGPGESYDWFNDPALGDGDMGAWDTLGQANPWYLENWTEVFRRRSNYRTRRTTLDLSGADNQQIYLAFWMDGSDYDLGQFDNVVITAVAIPEPTSWGLLIVSGCLLLCIPRFHS